MISELEVKKLAESLVIVASDRFKTTGDASNWIKDQLDLLPRKFTPGCLRADAELDAKQCGKE
jgi:hypothetical protein